MKSRDEHEIWSVDDLKRYSGISRAVVEILERNNVLSELSATNQMTLF